MPFPTSFQSARLIVDGQSYELLDARVRMREDLDRQEVQGINGRIGMTRGMVTTRISIEAELMPVDPQRDWMSDGLLRNRIVDAVVTRDTPVETIRDIGLATGTALDALAATFGVSRQPATPPAVKESFKPKPKKAPEPRSAIDRLLDPSFNIL